MTRIILALLLISTPAAAQQPWGQPVQRPQPQIIPAPGQIIITPQGNVSRFGPYVQYPNGETAIVNPNGLTTWSNGAGCNSTGKTTYCW